MKVRDWIFFENPGERDELNNVLKDVTDTYDAATIISKAFNKELPEALKIAKVYFENINLKKK